MSDTAEPTRTFAAVASDLHRAMVERHLAVDPARNPVSIDVPAYSDSQLLETLVQYSVFSRKIVSFLVDANYVMVHAGWPEVAAELKQNISEEFGEAEDGTDRLPHYNLLRKGFLQSLGVDLADFPVKQATQAFIDTTHRIMADRDAAFVAGAVYALESTARPELLMTYEWTKQLYDRHETAVPNEVRYFFLSHIDEIEILHEGRLRDACAATISSDDQISSFESGFTAILDAMDSWWTGLSAEAQQLAA